MKGVKIIMEKPIKYGILNSHTENSLLQSAMSVQELVSRAAELGAPAVALTDHGVMTGIHQFIKECNKQDIKPIPGVEIGIKECNILEPKTIILMAKDAKGLSVLNKVVTESNKHMVDGKPCVNLKLLKEYFGPKTAGNGHVIATTGGVNGYLSATLLSNLIIEDKIADLELEKSKLDSSQTSSYQINLQLQKDSQATVENLVKKRDELNRLSKKAYAQKEKGVNALKGSSEYEVARRNLDAEKAESENAKEELKKIRIAIATAKRDQRALNKQIQNSEEQIQKRRKISKEIATLEASMQSDEELIKQGIDIARQIQEIFGRGNTYIDLQYNGLKSQAYLLPKLIEIATKTKIPVVASNDIYMSANSEEDIKARQIMCSLQDNVWVPRADGDEDLYIKTDDELSSKLKQVLPTKVVNSAMNNIGVLMSSCNFTPIHEKHYPKFISNKDNEDADARLRRLAYEGIPKRYPDSWDNEKEQRLELELKTISDMGVSDYHCIVQDYIKEGNRLATDNPEQVGLGVGPGRGSAAGSLVCYLIGITDVDPMKYNLLFERFLNKERVSMPDIDVDFHTELRSKVIDYVKHKYGAGSICNILTKNKQKAKGAIRNCARLLGSELHDNTQSFYSLGDEIAKAIPTDASLSDVYDDLISKFRANKHAVQIIENAMLVEGTLTSYSVHAAGVVMSDNNDISELVALMYDVEKDTFKSQCDMNEIEELGLLKMDFLGLNNLDIITSTLRTIKRQKGLSIDIKQVPFERDVFKHIYAKGFTNNIFQFESGGMKQMLRQFQPEKFEDIILLVAAYRPGPMQYLPNIIAVKHGKKKPQYIIPELEEVLGVTYGYPVYQEQIIQIFNRFAGFSLGEADIIRRHMSSKNINAFMQYQDLFVEGMVKSGAIKKDALNFWEELIEFSRYAFNKSHAAAYALLSYYTAWLKHYFPVEFITESLNHVEPDKYVGLIGDCRELGIEIKQPNINVSEDEFSIQNGSIVFGLSSIKYVGKASSAIIEERRANGNYLSFADFLIRSHSRKDVTENLIKAGTFDSLVKNRNALLFAFTNLNTGRTLLNLRAQKQVLSSETNPKKLDNARKAYHRYATAIMEEPIEENYPETPLEKLNSERELLGVYVSGHPIDEYRTPEEMGCSSIKNLAVHANTKVMGLITNLRLANRKTDNKPMAFFDLEDQTDTISVCCFTKAYADYGDLVSQEGTVVMLQGKVFEETGDNFSNDDVANIDVKFNMKQAYKIEPIRKQVVVSVRNLVEWSEEIYPIIKNYRSSIGDSLVVHDQMMEEFRETNIKVATHDLLNNTRGLQVSMM